ncbi:NUDIX hydrolase [Cystobacter fuscus]|uniref:NUDIX hydrolase n=1 Tax=Cystobacter fuscus TaxID=43 RepID=A0A250IXR6_9BACT|nr:NUDIX hydrolase [Cystobacter fuscus]ATB35961.1 NUDIX hydrolase [Cystobacter fuscus]
MSEERSWTGNWAVRLYERVRERGYDSLTAFADARPTASLVALAKELGEDDIAGVQVLRGLLAEAEQRKQVTRFVRDVFVRLWSQSVPGGWPAVMDDANRFKVAKALGSWFAYTPETHKECVDQASDALLASPPPPGWRPLGPDDELLRTLLPDEFPRPVKKT